MYIKVKEAEKAARLIAEHYNIEFDNTCKMIGYYNRDNKGREKIQDVLNGYYDNFAWAMAADDLGISHNIEYTPIERVTADIVPETFGDLPPGLVDTIKDRIQLYCNEYHIDDMRKAPADVWAACCMSIGSYLTKNKITIDTEKQATRGGQPRNPELISNLIDLWYLLCLSYNKPPLMGDFALFAGVSFDYILEIKNNGAALTSERVEMRKKLHKFQEMGLSRRLADGRQNPTGSIFILKNLHGWRDERTVEHIQGDTANTAVSLPRFNMQGIEEKP